MAKIQFLPALLALNVGVVIILIALTLLFGRVYCSVICPLGVFQDVVSWLGKKRKKNRYSYSPALNWLRYGVLGVFVVALIAGVGSLVALLAPYSSYGRIASNLFAPVYQWGNNLLALLAERAAIDHNLLKLDILGHDDPTMIRMLQDLIGLDPVKDIPLDSPEVMSLFQNTSALGITPDDIGGCPLGALGVPEFGTDFAMQMLLDTKPKYFSDLVRIAGLAHGTDVWLGNAQTLAM